MRAPMRSRRICRAGRAGWPPHVLRHYCASQLYQAGVDMIAVQKLLGHSWISTRMRYVHVHATRVEDAVMAGRERAAARWEGLLG
jgi:integrase/recombinase XerD